VRLAYLSLLRKKASCGVVSEPPKPPPPDIPREIMQNAISAGTRDPRFPPVHPEELDQISYSVDVLAKPEPISSMEELDPRQYGVIVEAGSKRGLLLPDLPGVDSPRSR
jgi:MEMO1 family protein